MAHESKFWNNIADKYFASPIGNPEAYEEKLRLTQEQLRPDMKVMEFGCGTGGTALRHAPHVAQIDAFDIAEAMLVIARRQADEQNVRDVTFQRADIAEMDVADDTYDAVLGNSILHLIEDPAATAKDVYRWLKPGGIFVSSTVCLGDGMNWLKLILPLGRAIGKVPYVQFLKGNGLVGFMTDAGFKVETHWQPGDGRTVFLICRKPG